MANQAPLQEIPITKLLEDYPDDAAAEKQFVEWRWPDGIACPHCGDMNIQENAPHPDMPFRCRGCRKFFSVKTKTVMQDSKLGYRTWLIAMHSLLTKPKGTSSIQLHKDLGITQKSAWFLAHRIRESWSGKEANFGGVVEVDETFVGGLEKNKHGLKKKRVGRGGFGKTIVAGLRERETGKVYAETISNTDRENLGDFVESHTQEQAVVYTDEHSGYDNIPRHHYSIRHKLKEYVVDGIHTNGIESVWACLKRAHKGTYHQWSRKHLHRYVNECCGRLNIRKQDVIDRMGETLRGMDGKQLTYAALVATPVPPPPEKKPPVDPMAHRWTRQRNQRNPNERLTDEEKSEIRRLYAIGQTSYRTLARKYNVSHISVREVVKKGNIDR